MSCAKLTALTKAKTILTQYDEGGVYVKPEDRRGAINAIDEAMTVDYRDILAATRLEGDCDYNPFDCDGLEHDLVTANDDGMRDGNAYVYHNRRHRFIVLSDTTSTFDYFRARGASRQVAFEKQAETNRAIIAQIKKYLTGDYAAYGIICEYEGYRDSCWGFEGDDSYLESSRHEIAGQVVYQMEKDGYTVTNQPEARSAVTRYSRINEQNVTNR